MYTSVSDELELHHNSTLHRSKRSVAHLLAIFKCVLHRSALDYNKYGCWCGYSGSGPVMDGIDNCCKHHDLCYEALINKGCSPHVQYYKSACLNGAVRCYTYGKCDGGACVCDSNLVQCLKKQGAPYPKKRCIK
ncbi:unnamed protein product [Soboliphyme baturini]|uniref:Phospholipase A2 n=1 Tax=Soboliphyme baturini TaxID=241478 RepID=A0A183J4Y5_9BILA|nr:unnamed protein product [Soboliphyme baturini]